MPTGMLALTDGQLTITRTGQPDAYAREHLAAGTKN